MKAATLKQMRGGRGGRQRGSYMDYDSRREGSIRTIEGMGSEQAWYMGRGNKGGKNSRPCTQGRKR